MAEQAKFEVKIVADGEVRGPDGKLKSVESVETTRIVTAEELGLITGEK